MQVLLLKHHPLCYLHLYTIGVGAGVIQVCDAAYASS
jgi:hypothetical protein